MAEKEYINKQELMKNFCGFDLTKCKKKHGNDTQEQLEQSYATLMIYEIAMKIDDAPVADVVEVVQCNCWRGTKEIGCDPDPLEWEDGEILEIVGNVFDNPEMMKGEN